jgi:hypothetical protein
MKKAKMLATAAAAVIVVVGVAPRTSTDLAANFGMFGIDSPVDISDGSLHGDVAIWKGDVWWTKTDGEVYTAKASDPDYITFSGFAADSGATPPSPLQNTGGWLILISNGEQGGGNINPDSISFCSTARADTPSCLLGKPGGDKWVYLETHPSMHGQWTPRIYWLVTHRLEFHDTRNGCGGIDGCDNMKQITIKTMNQVPGANGDTYKCKKVEDCHITVGQ